MTDRVYQRHLPPGCCGNCVHWDSYDELGATGYCERPKKTDDARFRITDCGTLETRIDFGCVQHQRLPKVDTDSAAVAVHR